LRRRKRRGAGSDKYKGIRSKEKEERTRSRNEKGRDGSKKWAYIPVARDAARERTRETGGGGIGNRRRESEDERGMPSSLPVVTGEDRSCAGWRFHRGGGRRLLDSVGDAPEWWWQRR